MTNIRVERSGSTAIVILDRRPLNVLCIAMQDELADAARAVGEDESIHSVVIWGANGNFSAGADAKEMSTMGPDGLESRELGLHNGFVQISRLPKPTVAAIEGYALGGGCELAQCADLRIAAEDATFGQPEISLGLIPGSGGTQRLSRLVGLSNALDLILTGRLIDAGYAHTIGLVNEIVKKDSALETALAWTHQFENAPMIAIAAAKNAIVSGSSLPLDEGLALERGLLQSVFASEDKQTGLRHFVTKEPGRPKFSGR